MNSAVVHYYKHYRAHGYTALAAWNSARSFVYFRKWLGAEVAKGRKRKRSRRQKAA
jgi:hypothetical protein